MRKKIKEVGGVTGHLERNRHRGLLLLSPFSLQGEKKFVDFEEKKRRGGGPPFFSLSSPCALSSVSSSILRKFFSPRKEEAAGLS